MSEAAVRPGLSLTAQVMALLLGAVITAQGVTILAVYLAPPSAPPVYSLTQLASALRGERLASDQDRRLRRITVKEEPAELARENSPRTSARLAALLGAPAGAVKVHKRGPPPFVMLTTGNPIRADQTPAPVDPADPALPPPATPRYGLPPMDGTAVRGEFIAGWQQADGRWVLVEPQPELEWLRRVAIWVLGGLLVMGPIGYWFARRISAPLQAFAAAADRLGRDPHAVLTPLTGPAEVGVAARALNAMQARIQRYVRDKVSMVGAISHDLRTPLTRIRFKLEKAPPAIRAAVLSDVEQMEHMIEAVIAFSQDSTAPSTRQPLDLASLLECLVDGAAATGADAQAVFDAPVVVEGDAVALQRLFSNLIDNAIKYGGSARVSVGERQDEAVVRVADSGPGLLQSQLETVFTPFYRTEEAMQRTAAGVGLGLSIARAVARAHGGDITLRSDASGLVAEVSLPLASASKEADGQTLYRAKAS